MIDNKPRTYPSGQSDGFFEEQNDKPDEQYSIGKTAAAVIAKDNILPNVVWKASDSALTAYEQLTYDGIENFDPLSEEERSKYDPKYWPILGTSKSPYQSGRKVYKAQQEEYYDNIIKNGSVWGTILGGIFNAPTSPATYIPIMRGIQSPKFLTSFGSAAVKAIPGIVAGAAVEETALHWLQETRKVEDSAMAVASSAVLGSFLVGVGAGVKTFGPKLYEKFIKESVNGADVKTSINEKGEFVGMSVQDGGSVGPGKSEEFPIEKHAGAAESKVKEEPRTLEEEQLVGVGKWYQPGTYVAGIASKAFRNPVVLGLTSKSKFVAGFTNDVLEHNMDIVGTYKLNKERQPSLQSKINDYKAMALKHNLGLIDAYYEQLEIDPSSNQIIKTALSKSAKFKSNYIKMEDFERRYLMAISNDGVDAAYPVVQKYAKKAIDEFLQPLTDELVGLKMVPPNFTPFGALRHFQRMYDKPYIAGTRPKREEFLIGEFGKVNDKITTATKPLDDLYEKRGRLETQKEITKTVKFDSDIKKLTKDINRFKLNQRNDIIKGKYGPELLVGKRGMDWNQIQELKKLRKPIRVAKTAVSLAEQDLKAHKRKLNEGRLPGERNKSADHIQTSLEANLKEKQDKLKFLRDDMNLKVNEGKLDKSLFFETKLGNYRLRKINYGDLKFRKILDEEELKIAASNTIDNILSLSQEDIGQSIMGTMRTGGMGDPMNPRQLLISDELLYKDKMLSGNAQRSMNAMMTRAGRMIEGEKYFRSKGYNPDSGKTQLDWLADGIKEDYADLRKAIDAKYEAKLSKSKTEKQKERLENKASKERLKLDDRMRKDIRLCSRMYQRVMGINDLKYAGLVRTFRALNFWAYASQLGNLILSCFSDSAAPAFRIGLPYVTDAVLPTIKSFVKMNGNKKRLRKTLADFAYANDTLQAMHATGRGLDLDFDLPMNVVERQAENAANIMGIINLSNSFTDYWKGMGGIASRSNMYRRMEKFSKGKLKGNQLAQLKVLRMNDLDLSNRFVDQFKKYGEKIEGAYEPNIHLWDDADAARRYRLAVRQEMDSTIFGGKSIGSYPIDVEFNGVANSFLMYLGYGFNAFTNFTLPLVQRVDTTKLAAGAAMTALAMISNPLRILSKGQELKDEDLDPKNIILRGVFNGPLLGAFGELINKGNAATDILPSIQLSRFTGKSQLELLSGAPYSLINFLTLFVGQAGTGEWNKKQLKDMKRNVPFLGAIEINKLGNDYIDSLDIPETRHQAHKEKLLERGELPEKQKKAKRNKK